MLNTKKSRITEQYKFVAEIGRGATGVCYKAILRNDNSVKRCIKKIKKNTSVNLTQNLKEVYFLQQLTHPNIVCLYDVYEDELAFYIVTDFCEGGELFSYLDERGVFSEHEARQIFIQIVSVVKYCHQKKISHRDLKPQNFLILEPISQNQTPVLKLIDFDLSFQWLNNMGQQILARQGKRIVGTPYYIAPEILEGFYNQSCDVWSIGVILYILVSGRAPFEGNQPIQIYKQIQNKKPKFDIQQMSQVSLLLKDLISKILVPATQRLSLEQILKHPWMRVQPRKKKFSVDYTSMIKYSKFSKLKQIAANYLAIQLASKQLHKYQQIFRDLDKNNDGFLSCEELKNGLSGKNQTFLSDLMHFIDMDNDGLLCYSDFLASFVNQEIIRTEKNLRLVFNKLDLNGDGAVNKEQLLVALKRHNMRKKSLRNRDLNEDSDKIFSATDKNNDGKIDFEEFVATICNEFEH